MDFKSGIDTARLPQHVAIIMDGNGRWAKAHGKPRVFGHRNGVRSVKAVTEAAAELGIPYLTLYAFSTENWNRPSREVNALMQLLVRTIRRELRTLQDNDIRLHTIGDTSRLPVQTANSLQEAIAATRNHQRMTLTLALNYSARQEMTRAARMIAHAASEGKLDPAHLDEAAVADFLYTSTMPDPELLIRTSGEFRISNFLLWQIAYAELYFTPVMWPDFGKDQFHEAIRDYQRRERRFGKTSEQLMTH
ncbi:MAG: isoprenyl transferase [Saprospiraceae bacterium]|nr:isoprenyl transferase [Saprospiraceae bacterium]